MLYCIVCHVMVTAITNVYVCMFMYLGWYEIYNLKIYCFPSCLALSVCTSPSVHVDRTWTSLIIYIDLIIYTVCGFAGVCVSWWRIFPLITFFFWLSFSLLCSFLLSPPPFNLCLQSCLCLTMGTGYGLAKVKPQKRCIWYTCTSSQNTQAQTDWAVQTV